MLLTARIWRARAARSTQPGKFTNEHHRWNDTTMFARIARKEMSGTWRCRKDSVVTIFTSLILYKYRQTKSPCISSCPTGLFVWKEHPVWVATLSHCQLFYFKTWARKKNLTLWYMHLKVCWYNEPKPIGRVLRNAYAIWNKWRKYMIDMHMG
jgi:hypothetical protein